MPNWNALSVSPAGVVLSLDYASGPYSWQPNGKVLSWLENLVTLVGPDHPLFDALLAGECFNGLCFGADGSLAITTEGEVNQVLVLDAERRLVHQLQAPNRDHRNRPDRPLTPDDEPCLEHPPGIIAAGADGRFVFTVFRSPRRLAEHAYAFDYWPSVWRWHPGTAPQKVGGDAEAPLHVGMDWQTAGLGLVRTICPRTDGGYVLHVERPLDAGSPPGAIEAGSTGKAESRLGDLPSHEHVVWVAADGRITAIWGAGDGGRRGAGQPAADANLEGLRAIRLMPDGQSLYLMMNSRDFAGLLRVGADGLVESVAPFDFPHSVAPVMTSDAEGALYWLETPILMRWQDGRGRAWRPLDEYWKGQPG